MIVTTPMWTNTEFQEALSHSQVTNSSAKEAVVLAAGNDATRAQAGKGIFSEGKLSSTVQGQMQHRKNDLEEKAFSDLEMAVAPARTQSSKCYKQDGTSCAWEFSCTRIK